VSHPSNNRLLQRQLAAATLIGIGVIRAATCGGSIREVLLGVGAVFFGAVLGFYWWQHPTTPEHSEVGDSVAYPVTTKATDDLPPLSRTVRLLWIGAFALFWAWVFLDAFRIGVPERWLIPVFAGALSFLGAWTYYRDSRNATIRN
jgi:hypothetical protein